MIKKNSLLLSILLVVALFIGLRVLITEELRFVEGTADESWAEFHRRDKMYRIKKFESEGSGQYVIYTLHGVDVGDQLTPLGEYTTCGRYKLSQDEIKFYGAKDFHCGNFSFLTDLLDPQVTTFRF